MPCFHPVIGYRSKWGTLQASELGAVSPVPVVRACDGCVGCRVQKTSEWAARAVLELRSFADSCFITLTYSPEHLPYASSLSPYDLETFWKRLRTNHYRSLCAAAKLAGAPKPAVPVIRYLACGEYGPKRQRPHYHAVVFGYRPSDGVEFKRTSFGPLFTSAELSKAWEDKGFVTFGDVAYESAAYVASYVQKKLSGKLAERVYGTLQPPFARMSRRPGLGLEAVYSLGTEFWDDKMDVGGGRVAPVPRYFMNALKVSNPLLWGSIKERRKVADSVHKSPARLRVREQVFLAKLKQSHKELDHGNFQPD